MYQKYIDEIKMLNQDENTRAIINILEKQQKDENTRFNTAINKAKAEVAKKLKENNVSIDIIISSTGLSKEEIEKL